MKKIITLFLLTIILATLGLTGCASTDDYKSDAAWRSASYDIFDFQVREDWEHVSDEDNEYYNLDDQDLYIAFKAPIEVSMDLEEISEKMLQMAMKNGWRVDGEKDYKLNNGVEAKLVTMTNTLDGDYLNLKSKSCYLIIEGKFFAPLLMSSSDSKNANNDFLIFVKSIEVNEERVEAIRLEKQEKFYSSVQALTLEQIQNDPDKYQKAAVTYTGTVSVAKQTMSYIRIFELTINLDDGTPLLCTLFLGEDEPLILEGDRITVYGFLKEEQPKEAIKMDAVQFELVD